MQIRSGNLTTSRTSALQGIKQPTRLASGQEGQRLVFIYPILFDSSLAKLVPLLRDFMSVDFISQIKVSNVLNITYDATRIGVNEQNTPIANPAELVRQAVFQREADFLLHQRGNQTQFSQFDIAGNKHEYQQKINQLLGFVKNQIEHNPRYSRYRPMISSLTVENLIDIPMIIGTHEYEVNLFDLYWVLLSAIAMGIPLDRISSIDQIERAIEAIPPTNYMMFLDANDRNLLIHSSGINVRTLESKANISTAAPNRTIRSNLIPSSTAQKYESQLTKYGQILSGDEFQRLNQFIQRSTGKTIRNFRNVLSENKWHEETDGLTTTGHMTMADFPSVPTSTQRRHMQSASASFHSFIANIIPYYARDLEMLLGPTPVDINIHGKINVLIDGLVNEVTNAYEQLGTDIAQSLFDMSLKGEAGISAATHKMNEVRSVCEMNVSIGLDLKKQMEKIDGSHIHPNFQGRDFVHFMRTLGESGNMFNAYSKKIEDWLFSFTIGPDTLANNLKSRAKKISQHIYDFIYRSDSNGEPIYDQANAAVEIYSNTNRYSVFKHRILGLNPGDNPVPDNPHPNPNREHPGQNREAWQLNQIVAEIYQSLIDVSYFLFLYNFLAYLCMYMQDVSIDIETQRKDALDFPNYCLVLPLDLLKGIYAALQIRNFKRVMYSREPIQDFPDLSSPRYTMNDMGSFKVVGQLCTRLKIPNLIAVDTKTGDVYYKFMYMSQVNKINMSSLEQYVQHQSGVLPGF